MANVERYSPPRSGRIAYEHLHRYAVAKDYVVSARVLEIGCGEGYGAFLMSPVARHVVGIDNSEECIAAARARYGEAASLEFVHADAAAIPMQDASFDVVVSLDTIEHLPDAARFLAEIKRVLKPDGLLILSTPNAPAYRQEWQKKDLFHLAEFDLDTLDAVLSMQYAHREFHGQRMLIASSLAPITIFFFYY